ncbi:MAG TPA: hypothetical protein VIL90_05815 [Puia sp.]
MKKFIILYKAPVDAMTQTANASPVQQAKGMEAWMQWAKRRGNNLVDMGSPLMNAKVLSQDEKIKESKSEIVGYSVLEAKDMEDAISLLKGHPHIIGWSAAASIEVHESMQLPGM